MPNLKPYLLLLLLAPMSVYATFGPEDSGDYLSSSSVTASQQQIVQDAIYIKQALVYQNYAAIAPLIHPTRGV